MNHLHLMDGSFNKLYCFLMRLSVILHRLSYIALRKNVISVCTPGDALQSTEAFYDRMFVCVA